MPAIQLDRAFVSDAKPVSRADVSIFSALVEEFMEVESDKNNDRPQLDVVLKLCRLTGSTLVAKLDC